MREIKFRAWDGARMFTVTDISWCACAPIRPVSVEGFTMVDGSSHCAIWDDGDEPDIILMQYTNRKDKNGKEIYSNDFVKDGYGNILLVDFWRGQWVLIQKPICRTETEGECRFDSLYDYSDTLEVIGNIYEGKPCLK